MNKSVVDLRVKKIGLKLYLCTSQVKVSLPGRPLQMCGLVQNNCKAFFLRKSSTPNNSIAQRCVFNNSDLSHLISKHVNYLCGWFSFARVESLF